jgi:hypothetical protein
MITKTMFVIQQRPIAAMAVDEVNDHWLCPKETKQRSPTNWPR